MISSARKRIRLLLAGLFGTILLLFNSSYAEEPPLPAGLSAASEPTLPAGLGGMATAESNIGLQSEDEDLFFDIYGFVEARAGIRTQSDPYADTVSMGETRLQLQTDKVFRFGGLKLTADFLFDPVADEYPVDLEKGSGFLDLREAYGTFRHSDYLDLKIGRQILTWGVGDLLFINDLFPKDWNSFFIGRDTEYLKAPSDTVKASVFGTYLNLDLVYTPRFDADRYLDGERISFFNSSLGRRSGDDVLVKALRPNDLFTDDEFAVRAYRNLSGFELAAYFYSGNWKSPAGFDPLSQQVTFPELNVWGTTVRAPLYRGIASYEFGFYDSRRDRTGNDPLVRNSELRSLFGYEQEVAKELTAGVQYYLEYMLDHDRYEAAELSGRDQARQVLTLRLTQLLFQQNLTLSLFGFYSPTDKDSYLRPNASYKLTDEWTTEFGGNIFIGSDETTFFGQFDRNSNLYVALRYSFL